MLHRGYFGVRGDDFRDVGKTLAVAEGVIRLCKGIDLVEVIYDFGCCGHGAYLLAVTTCGRRGRRRRWSRAVVDNSGGDGGRR